MPTSMLLGPSCFSAFLIRACTVCSAREKLPWAAWASARRLSSLASGATAFRPSARSDRIIQKRAMTNNGSMLSTLDLLLKSGDLGRKSCEREVYLGGGLPVVRAGLFGKLG